MHALSVEGAQKTLTKETKGASLKADGNYSVHRDICLSGVTAGVFSKY